MLDVQVISGRLLSRPSINGLFVQYLRYTEKIILKILKVFLRLFFQRALILNKNPRLWVDTVQL